MLVLVGVAAIAFGFDTRVLSKLSSAPDREPRNRASRASSARARRWTTASARTGKMGELSLAGRRRRLPPLDGLGPWINSKAAHARKPAAARSWSSISGPTRASTACARCRTSTPGIAKLNKDGLVVLGVHSPEFAFEKDIANVRKAVTKFDVQISGRARQLTLLGSVQQQVLARALFRRRERTRPGASLRRGQVREVGTRDPPAAHRGRPCADGRRHGAGRSASGAEAAAALSRASNRPRPTSATPAPTASSRPAG